MGGGDKCYIYKIIENYLQSCNKYLIDQACSGSTALALGQKDVCAEKFIRKSQLAGSLLKYYHLIGRENNQVSGDNPPILQVQLSIVHLSTRTEERFVRQYGRMAGFLVLI